MKFYLTIAFAVIQASCLQLTDAQFITFKDGKIGVNFMGYHAAAGLGGGTNGGFLAAEAGTPYGPAARAGLGGGTDHGGRLGGKLYADATAGGGINARAGLGGVLDGSEHPKAAGEIYSGAQAGSSIQAGAGLYGQRNGGQQSHVESHVYSGGANGGETAFRGGVVSDGPPRKVIYTKTVQEVEQPSRGGEVYKVNTKVVNNAPNGGGVHNRYNSDEGDESSSEENVKSHIEENIYYGQRANGGLNGGINGGFNGGINGVQTEVRSSVGPGVPSGGVIYSKTVHAVAPSPGHQVYKVTKTVSPSGGVVNRYNSNNDYSSEEDEKENVQAPVRKVPSEGSVLGGFNGQASLEGQTGGPTQFIPQQPPNGVTKYVSKNKIRTEYHQGPPNEVAGGPNYNGPNVGYVESNYQPLPPAPVGGNFVQVEKYIETEPIHRRPHHHRKHGYKYITRYVNDVDNQGAAPPPPPPPPAIGGINSGVTYEKRVQLGHGGGTFFDDIFNIPISALRSVSGFLSNNVPRGNVEVRKTIYTN